MSLLVAIVVALLFGAGAHLMVRQDVVKLAVGTMLLSNAALLLLVAAADSLVQALALTAVVIGFGTTVLLLRVGTAVERSHDTIELSELVKAEEAEDEEEEAS